MKPTLLHSLIGFSVVITNVSALVVAARSHSRRSGNQKPKVFVGIFSAPQPKYIARRKLWRESKCAQGYIDAGFDHAFFLGAPLDPKHRTQSHAQGVLETPMERDYESAMFNESEKYHDIEFVPFRDFYGDLSFKLIRLLQVGYDRGADYIVKHDDEYCVSPEAVIDRINQHRNGTTSNIELYTGHSGFLGTEYKAMRGANGMVAPYFNGWGIILSRGLVKFLVQDDLGHSVMFGPYGNDQDDSNLGKWVSYAQQRHNLSLDTRGTPRMLLDTNMSMI